MYINPNQLQIAEARGQLIILKILDKIMCAHTFDWMMHAVKQKTSSRVWRRGFIQGYRVIRYDVISFCHLRNEKVILCMGIPESFKVI